jgi:hypothetical protein
MELSELDGKLFTLWLTDDQKESAVFAGTARWTGTQLQLDRVPNPSFEIRAEWQDRIRAVPNEEVRQILLGAEYYLRLYVGSLPSGSNETEFEQTGLKWPK